jgi:hypothetical protein
MKVCLGRTKKALVPVLIESSRKGWRRLLALTVAVLFALYPIAPASLAGPIPEKAEGSSAAPSSSVGKCTLNSPRGKIQHVIYIQFDNVHFTRDNPSVPSDLEQMPHLLNFMVQNGVLLSNHHTPLISHTADDIITSLTGVYGDRHGQPIANSYNYFNPNAFDGLGSNFTSSFTYWTDPVDGAADSTFSLLTPTGQNAPAPWVPFTRAGCNVGAVSIANMELENVSSDLRTVFANDPVELAAALQEAKTNFSKAVADFEGIAIHCAAGNAVCASQNHGEPDVLPQEPNGYKGFNALYGHTFVAPVIAPQGLNDLSGNPITGFPGFGGISAHQTLAYVAAMLENGVPVTYSYISDAHESHKSPFRAFGPGEQGYVQQLATYDDAFNKFFTRLAGDGIDASNTLFVITSDENDHFVGGPPTNPGCDGINMPCTYMPGPVGPNTIGEILTNIQALLVQEDPTLTTPFDIHFDMAPAFYVKGQPATGSAVARQFEHDAANLTAVNPRTGNTDTLTRYLADPVELKLLHMITGDPLRTPTFVMFGDPDYFFQTFVPAGAPTVGVNPSFAWNHGGVAPEINNTWLGMVGPGVDQAGIDNSTWSDHTDIRPTMLVLLGLTDDYQHEGRALTEKLSGWAQPSAVKKGGSFVALAQAFKQINAPVGALGLASLQASTVGLESSDPGDVTYSNIESQLASFTSQRDALAAQILALLEDAEFNNQPIPDQQAASLIQQAQGLLSNVQAFANNP